MDSTELEEIRMALPYFLKHRTVWSSYDSEADVLYLHFKTPNQSDNSEMTEDEIIVRYENREIIGITILNASQQIPNNIP